MQKRRIALLYDQPLLGESLEHLLNRLPDIEIVASWTFEVDLFSELGACLPDLLLVAVEEPYQNRLTMLTAQLMDAYPDLPLIRVELSQDILRVYTSQTTPARSADLIKAINRLPHYRKGDADLHKDPSRS